MNKGRRKELRRKKGREEGREEQANRKSNQKVRKLLGFLTLYTYKKNRCFKLANVP
jgi:hypothetical protein